MKKVLPVAASVFLLLLPAIVSAATINYDDAAVVDVVDLTLSYTSGITSYGITTTNYATDYQATVDGPYGDEVDLYGSEVELFCVENQAALIGSSVQYSLYTLDNSDLKTMRAAWIADTYVDAGDATKGQAQIAIWYLLNTVNFISIDDTEAKTIYNDALKIDNDTNFFDTSGWLLAYNEGAQDYLVAAPVPEPATMLLLGTGLVGLAGVSRKKFKK